MMVRPFARAAASNFCALGSEATQRGFGAQFCLRKSSISSAVVAGSTLKALSSGAGGALIPGHSSMMVWADDGELKAKSAASAANDNAKRERNMASSRW